ncbi:MAG: hypothetical protein MMC33_005634 [Icmadophila ericetorum]|nr:hypothetical protein [Icmadophila ericetorum]
MSLPKTQEAVVIVAKGKAELVSDRPIPKLRDGYILIKTKAVAINPTDWKHVDYLASEGALCGCDYSGIVVEVGSGVSKPFKKGDKVFGFVHGGDAVQHENGAFAQYIVAKGDLQTHIPENLSFEEAATLGVGVSTVGQGLYQSLQLPLPTSPAKQPFSVLIYGGSTATGTLAIQFAKLSGLSVITTSSPRNFSLCKSLGADHTFDYNDPSCAEQIQKITDGKLEYAFDTISNEQTAAICVASLNPSKSGVRYSSLLPMKRFPRDDIFKGYTLAYTTVGEYFRMGPNGPEFPGKEEDFEFAKKFWGIAEKLLGEGNVKVHPYEVRAGGLQGTIEGMGLLRENKVSGKKLVYKVDETS